jgi:hypothetical protein
MTRIEFIEKYHLKNNTKMIEDLDEMLKYECVYSSKEKQNPSTELSMKDTIIGDHSSSTHNKDFLLGLLEEGGKKTSSSHLIKKVLDKFGLLIANKLIFEHESAALLIEKYGKSHCMELIQNHPEKNLKELLQMKSTHDKMALANFFGLDEPKKDRLLS